MAKLPPPRPEIIGAQRFFARVRSFDAECPHCGRVYRIRADAALSLWSPRTARFTCKESGGCGRTYVIGLLAWPAGTGRGSNTPPADQVPGPRQLGYLRQDGDGWWLPDEYKHKGRPDPTNLALEPERPEPEDPTELQLLDTPATEPRCLQCLNPYNPLKSKAGRGDLYCSATCEEMAHRD